MLRLLLQLPELRSIRSLSEPEEFVFLRLPQAISAAVEPWKIAVQLNRCNYEAIV
jgi:hypothetical protein